MCTVFGNRFEHLSNTENIYCEKFNKYCYNKECLDNNIFV